MNNRSSRAIQTVITFDSNVRFRRIIYQDTRNWTRKLLTNSKGHNFWLGCMCEAHDISGRLTMNNQSSREIQMVITFHSNVWFRRIIFQDDLYWTRKLSRNSKGHHFSLGYPIQVHNLSTRSKFKYESSWAIQMVITFPSEVRFGRIIYLDAQNLTAESLEKFKLSLHLTRMSNFGA